MKTTLNSTLNPLNLSNLVLFAEGRAIVNNERKGLTFRNMMMIVCAVTSQKLTGKEPISEVKRWAQATIEVLKNFKEAQPYILFPKALLRGKMQPPASTVNFEWLV